MQARKVGAAALLWLCASAQHACARSPMERQVLDALNAARTDPAAYAQALRRYRSYFHANLLRYPGRKEELETEEGVAVVNEAIAFVARQSALPRLAGADLYDAAAGDLAADQAGGGIGHRDRSGAMPGERARRHGGGGAVAEVVAYGPADAEEVVRQLIVDDGVAGRGHRSILYSPEWRFAGVSCGPHPQYRTVCVIDLGTTPDAR